MGTARATLREADLLGLLQNSQNIVVWVALVHRGRWVMGWVRNYAQMESEVGGEAKQRIRSDRAGASS